MTWPSASGPSSSICCCSQTLQAGNLSLDTRSRRVFLDGQEVPLKNKEYELLLFFMRNPGTVFDRETLYERVWGLEALGDNATVAVHINRLRESWAKA